jgi:hypothetical protein
MVVFAGDVDQLRHRLASLAIELGRPLHYHPLSSGLRLKALTGIAEIDGWEGYVFETAKPYDAPRRWPRR